MDEDGNREIFRTLPFELNTIIVKLLEPEEKIRFGRVSKFCHELVANFEDRISKLFWKGLTNGTNGPDVFSFEVQNSTDVYIFGVRVAPRQVRVAPRVPDGEVNWVDFFREMIEEHRSFDYLNLGDRRSPSPPYNSSQNNYQSLVTLKKRPKDSQNLIQCWQKQMAGSCFQVAIEFFADLLRYNQESIEKLKLILDSYVTRFLDRNPRVENWLYPTNLKSLEVTGNLKMYANFEKIYTIDTVSWISMNSEMEDLARFKSSNLTLPIGSITEGMFKNYLTDWRDNKLHQNLKRVLVRGLAGQTKFSTMFQDKFAVFVKPQQNIPNGVRRIFIIKTADDVDFGLYGSLTIVQRNQQTFSLFEVLKTEKKKN